MKSSAFTFRTAIQQINGLSFIYENLPLHSPLGRKKLMELPYSTDRNAIELELQLTSQWVDMLRDESKNEQMEKLSGNLSSFHDISPTLSNLAAGKVMDDIQLFEVKKFAILTENILNILNVETLCAPFPETVLSSFNIHSLCDVIALLDPEQNRIPHFYIYAQYSDELAEKRALYLQEKEVNKKEALFIEMSQLEDQIREELSVKLSPFSSILSENAQHIATLDLSLAKAKLSLHLGLSRPEIAGDKTTLCGLFHPEVQSYLHSQSKQFQPIDIEISCAPLLITGANMSGKTVILKSIALAQTLLQFGFYVPARHASLMLMDEVMLSMGEQGRGEDGLSSFATEILLIDRMLKTVKKNVKIMALVDELARTTNPEEGKRIVKAFLEIMQAHNTPAIVTTHYAGIGTSVRRLRVKGLDIVDSEKITPATLNDHIDYSLVEVTQDDVPEEALRIAEILGVEEELVRKARK